MTYHHFTVYGTRWWSRSLAIAQRFHADQVAVAESRPEMHWAPSELVSSDRLPRDDNPEHPLTLADEQGGTPALQQEASP